MKRLLIQTQLSSIDGNGVFVLENDSGWQMVMGRVREMLKLNPDLEIDVMGPRLYTPCMEDTSQVRTMPKDVNPDLDWNYLYAYCDPTKELRGRLNYIQHDIVPNALATRYDFNFDTLGRLIGLQNHKKHPELKYDAVYINDPMHLRNFKAMFMLKAGYKPKFFVHSHFIDIPECPKFPPEASLWLGQCEAALKADYNFWQCESSMNEFFDSMGKWFTQDVIDDVRGKSAPWDDGYSQEEITSPIDQHNMRFTPDQWQELTRNKVVLFFPNRVAPSSGDYTNSGKFLYQIIPALRALRQDFVVIANPSKYFSREQLDRQCGPNGFISLVDDGFNRDEYKFVARASHIAVGLYDKDAYGGTAARECIELGCMPLWLANNEYLSLAREAEVGHYVLAKPDFSDIVETLDRSIGRCRCESREGARKAINERLLHVIRRRCSYEATTPAAMVRMGLL